jgi:arginyl-tRNA synthetase
METFQSLLSRELSRALSPLVAGGRGSRGRQPTRVSGDYQTNAALILAKQRSENPRAVAQKIIEHLDVAEWCASPSIAGAGFINFALKRRPSPGRPARLLKDDRLGVPFAAGRRRIVIDFGSPNVAKTDARWAYPQHSPRRRPGTDRHVSLGTSDPR